MDLLEAYKIANNVKSKIKDLGEKERKKVIDNLKDEESEAFINVMNGQIKINYVFSDDDKRDYTEDIEELKARANDIKDAINSYSQEDLFYTKESLTENNYILQVLAHCIKDTTNDLDAHRLNTLIDRYNNINDFIYNDENHEAILEFYNDIVYKDDNGYYEVNKAIIKRIIQDSELNIDLNENENVKPIKDAINEIWQNKKEILNPNDINKLSEEQNGINFKQFIFCEEYLKRGKIKPTCEYLGISRNTAYLWLKDENVTKYLEQRKQEIKQETEQVLTN